MRTGCRRPSARANDRCHVLIDGADDHRLPLTGAHDQRHSGHVSRTRLPVRMRASGVQACGRGRCASGECLAGLVLDQVMPGSVPVCAVR